METVENYKDLNQGGGDLDKFWKSMREDTEEQLRQVRERIKQQEEESVARSPDEQPYISLIQHYRDLLERDPFSITADLWRESLAEYRLKLAELRKDSDVDEKTPSTTNNNKDKVKVEEGGGDDKGKREKEALPLPLPIPPAVTTINKETTTTDSPSKPQENGTATGKDKGLMYELYSVLVHSGSTSGGHYYAYIKSFEKDKWYIL